MAAFQEKARILFLYVSILLFSGTSAHYSKEDVHLLRPNVDHPVQRKLHEDLDLFCYKGRPKPLLTRCFSSFTSNKIHITSDVKDFEFQLYVGDNASHVRGKFEESQSLLWVFWTTPWQSNVVAVPQFNETCLGVYTRQPYNAILQVKAVDVFLLAALAVGLVLYFSAKHLSRNVVFYYGTGVSIGIIAALLLLVFTLKKFIPYGNFVSFIALFCNVAVLYRFWENLIWISEGYSHYLIGYTAAAGVCSFLFCYWRGPVTNQRTLDVIRWTIQFASLLLIYNSIQVWEVAVVAIITLILFYHVSLPKVSFHWVFRQWHKRFPRSRKLLSQDEFKRQGQVETQKALEELRQYCRSPDCDAWRTVSRIKSPQRFAQFVGGDEHLTDDEVTLYEDDIYPNLPEISDDEDEMDFRLSSQ